MNEATNDQPLKAFHTSRNARFIEVNGQALVADYGEAPAEYEALQQTVGLLDLSARGRVCLFGGDRKRFLHGQVTNDINRLQVGEGCYAALVTAKGKMISDLDVLCLEGELLLDCEPGFTPAVVNRLEKYVISEDVLVADVAPEYGLLSLQGPKAAEVLARLELPVAIPSKPLGSARWDSPEFGETYLINRPRLLTAGYEWVIPNRAIEAGAERLWGAVNALGGRLCGWNALEVARVEAGIPRFGTDMDEANLPSEASLEARALSYTKGCYIGQEVLNRLRTYGQVSKALRKLRFADLAELPRKGDLLFSDGKEVGYVTSAVASPVYQAMVGLGYVRRECNALGTRLQVRTAAGESEAVVLDLPFAGRTSEG